MFLTRLSSDDEDMHDYVGHKHSTIQVRSDDRYDSKRK